MSTRRPQPCKEEGCGFPKIPGKHRCTWHYQLTLAAEEQVAWSRKRLEVAQAREGYEHRPRVPQSAWPAGHRWCSGCQTMVPLFFCQGSRCKGCASLAAHASHIERTYGLSRADYDRLYAYQKGRCYICGQRPRGRRLAVDHDHLTGRVRGLLCASDEWGCNHRILGAIEGKASADGTVLDIARRIVAYFEQYPYDRMLVANGLPPREEPVPVGTAAPVAWGWGGPPPAEDPIDTPPF